MIDANWMKNIINYEINKLNDNQTRDSYYNSCSMEHILPEGIIQHTLSFINPFETKSVSKTFQK